MQHREESYKNNPLSPDWPGWSHLPKQMTPCLLFCVLELQITFITLNFLSFQFISEFRMPVRATLLITSKNHLA